MTVENETQGLMDIREEVDAINIPNITDINDEIEDMNDNMNDELEMNLIIVKRMETKLVHLNSSKKGIEMMKMIMKIIFQDRMK